MTAKQTQKRPRWTLAEARRHSSVLRDETTDLDANRRLASWARLAAWTGWGIATLLAVASVYLVLYRMPQTVTFVQEEHGAVTRLPTLPSLGEAYGHHS